VITIANASATAAFSFRNPPHFMTMIDPSQKDALYETDALLDHLFHHPNVAPFVAKSLIQRLVTSNPSPRYVATATAAFRTGRHGGRSYGGHYGDVGATVAAILLDSEARSLVLDSDPTHGQIREPLVRVFALMRAMQFMPDNDGEVLFIRGENLEMMIGQGAYNPPSVFNFYTQDFQPNGPVQQMDLFSPEATLATLPFVVGLVDGITSLVFDGLTGRRGGFGVYNRYVDADDTYPAPWAEQTNNGYLHWQPANASSAESVVDELSLLLTSGRLDEQTRKVIIEEYNAALHKTSCPVDKSAQYCGRLTRNQNLYPGEFITNAQGETLCYTRDGVARHIGADGREVYSSAIYTRGQNASKNGGPNPFRYRSSGLLHIGGYRWGRFSNQKWNGHLYMPGANASFHSFLNGNCKLQDQKYFEYSAKHHYNSNRFNTATITCNAPSTCVTPPPTPSSTYAAERAKTDAEYAYKVAMNLITLSAAAATTNYAATTATPVPPPVPRASLGRPYKALVILYMAGGADTFNFLIPHSNCDSRNVSTQYATTRTTVALDPSTLLQIELNTSQRGTQVCDTFGLHPRHQTLQQLWNDGDAAMTANVGSLVEPMTLQQYIDKERQRPAGLFAHNLMTLGAHTMFPQTTTGKTGIIGRVVQALEDQATAAGTTPLKASVYSVTNSRTVFRGSPVDPMLLTGNEGMKVFQGTQTAYKAHNVNETNATLASIGRVVGKESGSVFSVTHNAAVRSSLRDSARVSAVLDSQTLSQWFPSTAMGKQLRQVAKVIAARSQFESERDVFYVELGGFDAHAEVLSSLDGSFQEINAALAAFVAELKYLGVWDQVTLQSMSEFGRTMTTNGMGTDHAWGGNHYTIGGAVRGKVMHGTFPELRADGPNCVSPRCPMLPSSSWEAIWKPLVQWLGVDDAHLSSVLPNINRFPELSNFGAADFFK